MSNFRAALYYPYIHIRNEQWLKATLLCAPTVKRIVPDGYVPEDIPAIVRYSNIVGAQGPLLQAVPAHSPAAHEAQWELLQKLREHEPDIVKLYDRSQAPAQDEYWIHDAKFSGMLLEYLLAKNLAWSSRHSSPFGHRSWYALHPVLGSALMTSLGLSIAREQQFDVVTPSNKFHEALLTTDSGELMTALLEPNSVQAVRGEQVCRDLSQMVVSMAGLNFEALDPEVIPELQSSPAFSRFQSLLHSTTQSLYCREGIRDYERDLKQAAQEIIAAWQETGSKVCRTIREALFEAVAVPLSAESVKAYVKRDGCFVDLAIASGVAVIMVTRKIWGAVQDGKNSRYQYLTEVLNHQDESLRMTFPLGLEREIS